MLEAYPQIIVENVKNASNSSVGFASTTIGVDIDLNRIAWNDIDGASLTTRNGSDVVVTSSAIGTHGRTDISINNPSAGDHRNNCYVTLPAGKYVFIGSLFCKDYNLNSESSSFELYNLSDSSIIDYLVGTTGNTISHNNSERNYIKFELGATKNLVLRVYAQNNITPATTNLGPLRPNGQKEGVLDKLIFTKIG